MSGSPVIQTAGSVVIRPMRESDLAEAARIVRVAFGTFIGVPDPESLWPDRDYAFTRFRNGGVRGLAAEIDGEVVGSNFATRWGSTAFFGPLTIRPDLWNQGVAQRLLAATMEIFGEWGVRDAGLFTFSHSPKHIALYQKFGFWPRFLTALSSKAAEAGGQASYSVFSEAGGDQVLSACRKVTDAIHPGLDVSCEIRAVHDQKLGDTVLVRNGDSVAAFAVCHCGEGTEAGKDACYIKFAAVQPEPDAADLFERLLNACEHLAAGRGLKRVDAGINLAHGEAYQRMLAHGFRASAVGVAMHLNDSPGFNRPGVFVVDDWR